MFNFKDKNVIVTGGAKGVGHAIAKAFHQAGARVCIADLHVDDTGSQENMLFVQVDVSNKKSVENLVQTVLQTWGTIDILINNASIYPVSDFLALSEDDWDTMMNVDLKSVYLCTQSVSKVMVQNKRPGTIINIGTIDALHPSWGHSHYSAAKAGAWSYTRAAAKELGQHGIRVNMVSPGLINRPGLADQWPDGYGRFMDRAALKRVPEAEDIANACLFLASDLANSITGVDLPVESGVLSAAAY